MIKRLSRAFASMLMAWTLCLVVSGCKSSSPSQPSPTPTPADTQAPTVDAFTLTSHDPTANGTITFDLSASDDTGVAGYLLNEYPVLPNASAPGWESSLPTSYELSSSFETKTVYAWVKDAADNVGGPGTLTVRYLQAGGEVTDGWNKKLGDTGYDEPYRVVVDSDDNVYVVGVTGSEWWIKKFDADGVEDKTNWDKKLTGGANSGDTATSAAVDADGNLYVVGVGVDLVSASSAADWWLKKFDANGTEDTTNWDKQIDINDTAAAPGSVAIDGNGNVYVVGYGVNLISGTSATDWWIKKFDADGVEDTTNWDKAFDDGSDGDDIARSVAIDADDNVYVVGYGTTLVAGTTAKDWWIKKFAPNGVEDTDWDLTYDALDDVDEAKAVAVSPAGNIYVVGYMNNVTNGSGFDWWIKKFDSTGLELSTYWDKDFSSDDAGSTTDIANSIAFDPQGNVYVVGYGTNLVSTTSSGDWWIKKFSPMGEEDTTAWNKKIDGGGLDVANSIAVDSNGSIYVVGRAENLVATVSSSDWWIKKFVDDRP